MDHFDWQIALTLGLLLWVALIGGWVAGFLRLPKVTAYLLAGVLLGPSALGCIDHDKIDLFEPLTKLAISLVLFNLGCNFPFARARRMFDRVVRLSWGEMSATFLLVFAGLLLLGQSWEIAALLGTLALATAPATTVLVLKESESEGPVTQYANAMVAVNNLVSIVLFELLFMALHFAGNEPLGGATAQTGRLLMEIGQLVRDLGGSVMMGVAGGLIVSYGYGLVAAGRRLVMLASMIVLLLAICQLNDMPYLLTFLAMGVTVANASDQTRQILVELDRLTGLLCVVFFAVNGAELEPSKLVEAGMVGVGYIFLRTSGKYLGTRFAATGGKETPPVCKWLGTTLLAQAGAAIALSAIAVQRTQEMGGALHESCKSVQVLILGTVVVFEIAGPILIRLSVIRAGEVPLAHAIRHAGPSLVDQFRTLINRLLIAAGRNPWKDLPPGELTVNELMRKNVDAIPQTATFNQVIASIEHSRDNVYPVVGDDGKLLGVIRYRELSSVLFDPALGSLVRATDVATPAGLVLYPDETIAKAHRILETTKDDLIPVVSREPVGQLVGAVRRRDILRLLIRGQHDGAEDEESR
jgi:Kef-type K+ transport system membrane component KefB/CBS domain-containing protein